MRKPLIFAALLLSLALGVLPNASHAVTPAIGVEAHFTLADTPLTLTIQSTTGLRADILVDGETVEENVRLRKGSNEITLDAFRVGTGEHQVLVRSANVQATTSFSALPGWLSLMPPIIAILLALIFRDVMLSLFLGIFSGALILNGWDIFASLGRTVDSFIVPALADADHAAILVFTTLLGGMVGLVTKSGGTHGIVEMLKPYATNKRRGLLATWAMGLVVFFDDYANTLIVGPTMRPITDRLRISREKLAYIVDSTAAPVVCLFPISTWVGFEIGLIGDAFEKLDIPYDAYSFFVSSLPYRFYPVFAIVLVVTLVVMRRDFGPMRKAEIRAETTGKVLADDAKPIADYSTDEVEPPAGITYRARNALLPILTVAVMAVVGLYVTGSAGIERGDAAFLDWIRTVLANADSYRALQWASLAGVIVALILPLVQRQLTLPKAMGAMVSGSKAMFMALMVLIMAWSLSAVCGGLGTAEFMVGQVSGSMDEAWLPAFTFLLAAAIAFATGSSWGTMAILEPLVIPICHSLALAAGHTPMSEEYAVLMLASVASVLTGSVWGDHCSPISDTTILSSMASGCDHIAHVRTQIPYAMTAGLIAIFVGAIPATRGFPAWLSLLVGMTLLVGGVWFLGRLQDKNNPGTAP